MSEWIRIRVKDFYKDAVGEREYTYVTREVYEALADTFRKEAHAQEMRDIRHTTKDGYTEGETEDLVELTGESVEDTVIRQMEIETLQKAMQSLTPVQRERLHDIPADCSERRGRREEHPGEHKRCGKENKKIF